jgi:hypothetical protein
MEYRVENSKMPFQHMKYDRTIVVQIRLNVQNLRDFDLINK